MVEVPSHHAARSAASVVGTGLLPEVGGEGTVELAAPAPAGKRAGQDDVVLPY